MSYEQEYCEDCKSANWVCLGDLNDYTANDVDGYICWNCGKKQLLSSISIEDLMDYKGCSKEDALEEAFYEDGYKIAGNYNTSFEIINNKKKKKKKKWIKVLLNNLLKQ